MKDFIKPTKKAYLSIIISEGQFSNEKSVRLKDYTGEESSGFFENKYIKDGKLEVSVLLENQNKALIKLPGRTLEGIGDKGYITVKKDNLEYVEGIGDGVVVCIIS